MTLARARRVRISWMPPGSFDTSLDHRPKPPCALTAFTHSSRNRRLVRSCPLSRPLVSSTKWSPGSSRTMKSGRYFRTTPYGCRIHLEAEVIVLHPGGAQEPAKSVHLALLPPLSEPFGERILNAKVFEFVHMFLLSASRMATRCARPPPGIAAGWRSFPPAIRFRMGPLRGFACHGSPRQVNEFLWETTTPSHFLAKLAADADCDVILGGHTGIHWSRRFARRGWVREHRGPGASGQRRANLRLVCYAIHGRGPAGSGACSGPLRSRGAGSRNGERGHL